MTLALLGPIVDVAALYGLTTGAREVALAWLGFTALQLVQGLVAFRLDHERPTPLLVAPLQQLCYRQLMYLAGDPVGVRRPHGHPAALAEAAATGPDRRGPHRDRGADGSRARPDASISGR